MIEAADQVHHTSKDSRFCNLCGEALGATYQVYEHAGSGRRLAICNACANRKVVCTSCGAPLADGHAQLSDGRPICSSCRTSAVDDVLTARRLYEQVIGVVDRELGLRVHRRPGFGLYSHGDMQRLQAALSQSPGGGGHLLGVYTKLGSQREIAVETGLPRLLMIKVIAHEYGHAWQGENCPFLTDVQLLEGFCEWVAYKVMGAVGAEAVQTRQLMAQGFYGNALRRIVALEVEGGIEAVLHTVRSP
ncbi:MAG: hypothetical protein IAE81_12900 [Caldilineaceae bacterium]|jgi:hypothetical protein|nr:hypothetical protein [Caldilineaceae bacterium]